MHLCDSNVWLALALSEHVHHATARDWLETIDEPATVLFCRSTQQTFLRLLTNASVLAPYGNEPLTNNNAWKAYEALVADDRIAARTDEPAGLEAQWTTFARRDTASPKLWMDAYLAAFALTEGCQMVTTDRAFKQFTGLDLKILSQPPTALTTPEPSPSPPTCWPPPAPMRPASSSPTCDVGAGEIATDSRYGLRRAEANAVNDEATG